MLLNVRHVNFVVLMMVCLQLYKKSLLHLIPNLSYCALKIMW